VSENRKWNVVAIMSVVLSLGYVMVAGAAMLFGKLEFDDFSRAVLPLVTAWGGYLAAMLKDGS
jgi:hypothetical protein